MVPSRVSSPVEKSGKSGTTQTYSLPVRPPIYKELIVWITFLCFKECISLHLLQRADSLTAAVSARDSGHGRYFYFHATAILRLSVSFKCNFEVNLEHCAAEWKQHALQPTTTTSLHHSSAVTDFFRQVCYTVFSTTATMSCKSLTQSSICGSIRNRS